VYAREKEVLKPTLKPSDVALVTVTFTGHDELPSELLRRSVTMAVFGTVTFELELELDEQFLLLQLSLSVIRHCRANCTFTSIVFTFEPPQITAGFTLHGLLFEFVTMLLLAILNHAEPPSTRFLLLAPTPSSHGSVRS
jgi:hypothetical protein